jgi:hypothetical protein
MSRALYLAQGTRSKMGKKKRIKFILGRLPEEQSKKQFAYLRPTIKLDLPRCLRQNAATKVWGLCVGHLREAPF